MIKDGQGSLFPEKIQKGCSEFNNIQALPLHRKE
jgi:hypothetical protein